MQDQPTPTIKLSRKEQKARTRERIIDAAVQVLLNEGFEGFKMRRIAKAAGIAQPSFYAHFENMDGLLSAVSNKVKEHYIYPMQGVMLQMVDGIEKDQLKTIFRNIYGMLFDMYLSNPELFCIALNEGKASSQYGKQLRKEIAEYRDIWVDFFGKNAHKLNIEFEQGYAELTIDCLFGMIDAMLLGYIEKRYTDKRKIVEILTEFTMVQLKQV